METNYEESYRRIMEYQNEEHLRNQKKIRWGNPLCHSDSNDIFDADVFHGQFESSISGALDCFFVYNFCLSDLCGIYGLYIAGASDRTWN